MDIEKLTEIFREVAGYEERSQNYQDTLPPSLESMSSGNTLSIYTGGERGFFCPSGCGPDSRIVWVKFSSDGRYGNEEIWGMVKRSAEERGYSVVETPKLTREGVAIFKTEGGGLRGRRVLYGMWLHNHMVVCEPVSGAELVLGVLESFGHDV